MKPKRGFRDDLQDIFETMDKVRRKYPKVPWTRMAGMLDRLIHGYFGIDLKIVWETVTRFIPELKPHIAHVLEVENPKGEAKVEDKESL